MDITQELISHPVYHFIFDFKNPFPRLEMNCVFRIRNNRAIIHDKDMREIKEINYNES